MPTVHAEPGTELFDGSRYEPERPAEDGHRADILRLAIGGQIDLDLYSEAAIAFFTSLRLGREIDLTIKVRVSGRSWRHALKGEDEADHLVNQVALKAVALTEDL